MGKVKVRTLGDETLENKQKQKSKQKGKDKSASRRMVKGAKGGERVIAVGPSEEEIAKIQLPKENIEGKKELIIKTGKKKFKKEKKAPHSKSYNDALKNLDRSKKYSLSEGLSILGKLKRSPPAGGFDETVELHINTLETGVLGNVTLPHGTGKSVRVAIADDDVLAKIVAGKIDFDVLLAAPIMMPKLARVAKILGPRGLMPNPKNGTLTKDPQTLARSFAKGLVNFKTELKAPIIHLAVGKMSYGTKKLSENIQTLLDAIKKEKIRNVTLKSTMSPGIKVKFGALRTLDQHSRTF